MPSISATTTSPCECCAGSLPTECRNEGDTLTLSTTPLCSTRTGTATLVGHSEFTSPSSPPKKYLVKTASGQSRACEWNSPGCTGTQSGADRTEFSGTCTYDAGTGLPTNTLNAAIYSQTGAIGCPGSPTFSSNSSLACDFEWTPAAAWTENKTATSYSQTNNGSCNITGGGKYRQGVAGDTRTLALTSEDTEASARARSTPTAWSAYGGCADGVPCCEASTTARGAGVFSFDYTEAKLRITVGGMVAGAAFEIRVSVYSRNLTTLVEAPYSVLTDSATADGSGAATLDFDLPVPASNFALFANSYVAEITALNIDPETWAGCVDESDTIAFQLYIDDPEGFSYNFVQLRAYWPGAVPEQERTVRFYWERTVWGEGAWSDLGYTDAAITGEYLPTVSYTDWVDVPNEEGFQTRLKRAALLPL